MVSGGPGLWGLWGPQGFGTSLLVRVSTLFGERLKKRGKSRLRPQVANITKKHKPPWGKSTSSLWGDVSHGGWQVSSLLSV